VYSGLWWGELKGKCHLEDLGVDGRIILKRVLNRWDGAVDWVDLVEISDKYRTVLTV
jgi:hypothetical protein